jgi:hypothetical protein
MKQPNFCKKCAYVLLCEAVSLVGHHKYIKTIAIYKFVSIKINAMNEKGEKR